MKSISFKTKIRILAIMAFVLTVIIAIGLALFLILPKYGLLNTAKYTAVLPKNISFYVALNKPNKVLTSLVNSRYVRDKARENETIHSFGYSVVSVKKALNSLPFVGRLFASFILSRQAAFLIWSSEENERYAILDIGLLPSLVGSKYGFSFLFKSTHFSRVGKEVYEGVVLERWQLKNDVYYTAAANGLFLISDRLSNIKKLLDAFSSYSSKLNEKPAINEVPYSLFAEVRFYASSEFLSSSNIMGDIVEGAVLSKDVFGYLRIYDEKIRSVLYCVTDSSPMYEIFPVAEKPKVSALLPDETYTYYSFSAPNCKMAYEGIYEILKENTNSPIFTSILSNVNEFNNLYYLDVLSESAYSEFGIGYVDYKNIRYSFAAIFVSNAAVTFPGYERHLLYKDSSIRKESLNAKGFLVDVYRFSNGENLYCAQKDDIYIFTRSVEALTPLSSILLSSPSEKFTLFSENRSSVRYYKKTPSNILGLGSPKSVSISFIAGRSICSLSIDFEINLNH